MTSLRMPSMVLVTNPTTIVQNGQVGVNAKRIVLMHHLNLLPGSRPLVMPV